MADDPRKKMRRYGPTAEAADDGFGPTERETGVFVRLDDPALVAVIAERDELRKVLDDLFQMINDSAGVVGLHLNGDVALWDELLDNEWLNSAARARVEAIKPQEGG